MTDTKIRIPCEACAARLQSCFGSLSEPNKTILESEKERHLYKKKHILFHEGRRPLGVFCIKRGKLKVFKIGVDGKEQIVQIAREGDILGYRALISEEMYPVSAQTLEETEACFVSRDDFFRFMKNSNSFTESLLKQACSELGHFTQKLTHQAQLSVRERFAITLHYLYLVYRRTKEHPTAEINLTREDLANLVGTATETLIRLVQDFKQEGIIDSQGRRIQIKKPDMLVKIGHIS